MAEYESDCGFPARNCRIAVFGGASSERLHFPAAEALAYAGRLILLIFPCLSAYLVYKV